MSGEGSQFDPTLLTNEITAENAADRALELQTARVSLEKQLADIAETSRRMTEEQARVQSEAEAVRNHQEERASV